MTPLIPYRVLPPVRGERYGNFDAVVVLQCGLEGPVEAALRGVDRAEWDGGDDVGVGAWGAGAGDADAVALGLESE